MTLNKVTLIGRLIKDPEYKKTPNGKTVTNITVATSKSWKNTDGERIEKSEFHNCVIWGKLGEIVATYGYKGQLVYLEGSIETRTWEKDGEKRYRTEIVASNVIMLSKKE